ncbi:SpoIIE family protein phosphatase, partial [Streptomyces sp. SM14]|uniref:SpoIIE family protein phosphatase n=1 Tax=Streptomyces sp. SM14 TaxID=1736045 RepID=UPI0015E1A04F
MAGTEVERAWGRKSTFLLPPLLLLVAVLLNPASPPGITFTPLFAAAPLVAAPLYGLRGTIAYGVAAVGLVLAVVTLSSSDTLLEGLIKVLTVVTVAVLAVVINLVVTRGQRHVANARAVAEAVQRAVVRDPPPALDGLRLATRYRAANSRELIGGDFYAAAPSPYGVRLILGDVRGKGLEATDSVTDVLGAFREAAVYEPELTVVSAHLEAALRRAARLRTGRCPDAEQESFVTAVLAELRPV